MPPVVAEEVRSSFKQRKDQGSMAMTVPALHIPWPSAATAKARVLAIGLELLFALLLAWAAWRVPPAAAGTPSSCAGLANFSHPDTTINSAQSQAGGAYVAPDTWHLTFSNL